MTGHVCTRGSLKTRGREKIIAKKAHQRKWNEKKKNSAAASLPICTAVKIQYRSHQFMPQETWVAPSESWVELFILKIVTCDIPKGAPPCTRSAVIMTAAAHLRARGLFSHTLGPEMENYYFEKLLRGVNARIRGEGIESSFGVFLAAGTKNYGLWSSGAWRFICTL